MPKWSEVPWGTVVTGLMAVYGAVLSTVTFRAQRAPDRLARREARGGQAEQIVAWLVQSDGPQEPPYRQYLGLMLQNRSSQPIYYLIASIVSLAGSGRRTAVGDPRSREFRTFVGHLPPGETQTRIEFPGREMHHRFGVELAFQDSAAALGFGSAMGS